MKLALLIITFGTFCVHAQVHEAIIADESGVGIPGVKVHNISQNVFARTDENGLFRIFIDPDDSIVCTMTGFDTLIITPKPDLYPIIVTYEMKTPVQEIQQANVVRKRLEDFDVGFLPPIKGVQIYTGTNAVIELAKLNGAKSTGNPREIFAKVPGLNIWESDGAGIQIGIGGRGLSPNRTANFNTRQNGYDISADALGYPESYYTPPIEALKSIEIIRGSASLQFGTQFGGLLNFIIKDPTPSTPFELTSRLTGATYGYAGAFNRIAGTHKRFSYQAYHQYKRGNGYRANSGFYQHQAFGQARFYITDKISIRAEYTHMNYLAQQAGGLTDLQFEEDPRQSLRDRNWFAVNWNMAAVHYDHEIGSKAHFNIRSFGMVSTRETLGFLGKITQADPGTQREMLRGTFKNAGIEARFLQRYGSRGKGRDIHGAFLIGGRYYQGQTTADQGLATEGSDADFTYLNPSDLEGSSYSYPSQNGAFFGENILFIGRKLRLNAGIRAESIQSGSSGYYKQYLIHPVNQDTLDIYTQTDTNEVRRSIPLFGGGISYKVGKRSTAYTNFTQNYRAINFTDIRINNPNIVIDSALRDEYGYTAELGFRGLLNDFWIYDVAAFYIFYGDKIGLAPKAGTTFKERTNIGDARNTGIEIFTEFDFFKAFLDSSQQGNHSLTWFVNAAYIHTEYIRSKESNYIGNQVEYVSPLIFKSGMKYRFNGWSIQVQGSYNTEQFSDASNSIVPSGDAVIGLIPSYLVFDFSGRYRFKKHFIVEVGINNFTNAKYFTRRATGYPGPGILPSDGINGYLTLQYQFRAKNRSFQSML